MTNNIENFDARLDDFLKKKMSDEEQQAFLSELKENPDLLDRAKVVALAIQQMKDIRKEQSDRVVDSILQMNEEQFRAACNLKPSHRTLPIGYKVLRYAAAACIVGAIGFGGYRFYQYDATVSLGNDYASAVPQASLSRGENIDDIKELQTLLNNVQTDTNISETAEKLSAMYYEAIGETYSDYSPFANTIGWNAAIAYLKDGNRDTARQILVSIRDINKDKAIADKADEIVRKIDGI